MDFKQSVIRCLRDKYVDFNGRASRSEYWWFFLACIAVAAVFNVLRLEMLGLLANLALLLPSLAVGARRLHDTGRSGWWQLIGIIPIVGWIVLIVFWVTDGHPGPNQHGPSPKYQAAGGYGY